ncbi:MAG TPA: phosphatase PAP2 family protein [Bacteroidales bacterium]|nr:phosphatase PAP2 family protein [Bacteroidales bacterium]HPS73695.1 phosphatase PAP2 family protein [Bacteroidales bacterium]
MIEYLVNIDKSLFLFLNGCHAWWLDQPMFWISKTMVWIPLYLLLLWLLIRKFGWKTLWILLFVVVMITVSDQLANVFKTGIQRLRPSHDPSLCCVHSVNGYKGGTFGFYSSHASNTFALAVFLVLVMRKYYRYLLPFMIGWAVLLSYSRIYLGVHFPGDILTGMTAGILLGFLFGYACRYFLAKISSVPKKGKADQSAIR